MDSEIEAPLKRSAIGGYAEKALYEAEQLAEAIREDQTELLPKRLADKVRRSEAELQQAKQREAEKRKREAAAMDMPPPDSWSVVAGRHRSRTIQSSGEWTLVKGTAAGESCQGRSWPRGPPWERRSSFFRRERKSRAPLPVAAKAMTRISRRGRRKRSRQSAGRGTTLATRDIHLRVHLGETPEGSTHP